MELNNDNRWKTRQELTYALMDLLRKWVIQYCLFEMRLCRSLLNLPFFFSFHSFRRLKNRRRVQMTFSSRPTLTQSSKIPLSESSKITQWTNIAKLLRNLRNNFDFYLIFSFFWTIHTLHVTLKNNNNNEKNCKKVFFEILFS